MPSKTVPPPPFVADVPRDCLSVGFRAPAPELRTLITGYNVYGIFDPNYTATEVYMPPHTGIRFNWTSSPWSGRYGRGPTQSFGSSVVLGPSVRNMSVHTPPDGISMGIGLTPLGLQRFLPCRADSITGKAVPLATFWSDADGFRRSLETLGSIDEVARFFDAQLLARLMPASSDAPVVAALSALMLDHHDLNVPVIAEHLGQSVSTLRRISLRHFGFPIKVLLRRSRFMKSLVAIYGQEPGNWARLIDPTYHDQSHFIKDFKYFMGVSPTGFLRQPSPMTMLSMQARRAVLGSPVAALHRTPD